MKRPRKMLLCVTATSMVTAMACEPAAHPVGTVSRPPSEQVHEDAGTSEAADAVAVDAGAVIAPSPVHRVGTTAESPEDYAPRVGTTSKPPDATP